MELAVINNKGEEVSKVEISNDLVAVDFNDAVVHQAVVRQLDKAQAAPRHVQKYLEGVSSHVYRNIQVVPDKDQLGPHNGKVEVLYLDQSQEVIIKK